MDAAEMGQGSFKASPTKDRITDDFYQGDFKTNDPRKPLLAQRFRASCVRGVLVRRG
jgi:hypothetical protein